VNKDQKDQQDQKETQVQTVMQDPQEHKDHKENQENQVTKGPQENEELLDHLDQDLVVEIVRDQIQNKVLSVLWEFKVKVFQGQMASSTI